MATKIRDTGPVQPPVRDSGPTMAKVDPGSVAKALGAEAVVEIPGGASHSLSMRVLGPELARRMRSTGGRPGLDGANEPMRIPVRNEDAERLHQVAEELGKEGVHVTPGQVGSVLIHRAVSQLKGVPSVEIDEIREPLATWTDRPYIATDVRPRLRKADVLLIPNESFREVQGPLFPVGTPELFLDLRDHAPKGLSVEICAAEDYREFAMYSALVILGGFVVPSVAAPILVNLLSDYLKRRLGSKASTADVKTDIILRDEQGTASVRLRYRGPVETFQEKMREVLAQAARTLPRARTAITKSRRSKAGGR